MSNVTWVWRECKVHSNIELTLLSELLRSVCPISINVGFTRATDGFPSCLYDTLCGYPEKSCGMT